MVLLIRRVWTGITLVAVVSAIVAGAPNIMSVDAQTYLSFLICAVWAPVAFLLTMAQQATGKSAQLGSDHSIL